MKSFVIDVNVLIAANGRKTHADEACRLACTIKLMNIKKEHKVVIDEGRELIFAKYREYCSYKPGGKTGDEFFIWLSDNKNKYNQGRCELVSVTPNDEREFEEFPDDPALAGFHRSDRVFVAVAKASANNPEILNATDSGWFKFEDALRANGVTVAQLCPQHLKRS
jgi:hypothetical protein